MNIARFGAWLNAASGNALRFRYLAFRGMARVVREREHEFARYELLCKFAGVAILFIDGSDGKILDVNDAAVELYGFSREEFLALNVSALRAPEDRIAQLEMLRGAEHAVMVYEAVGLRKDGQSVPIECSVRTAMLDGKQIVIGVVRDITERRRADEMRLARDRAIAASKVKGEFLAMMSHEIRTPINGVIGVAELLMASSLTHEQREYASTVSESAETLLRIINDILDFSKIEAGKLVLETSALRPERLVEGVTSLLGRDAQKKGVTLHAWISPHVPAVVWGDQCRVRQVLWNLVGNAVKFTDHGEVCITVDVDHVYCDGILARFTVRDTGVGISLRTQQELFEPFVQGDESTTRRFGGTGLGLSIARRLVRLMGGELTLTSREGEGTSATFTTPFKARPELGTAPVDDLQENAGSEQSLSGRRILLVEDNEINRRVASRQLARLGCDIVLAHNGREGVTHSKREVFDVILMDCNMPEMDGYAATRAIRAFEERRKRRQTPIVALTANAMEHDRRRCLDVGMNDYLSKPLTLATLQRTLERWAAQHPEEVTG
jgi:PAS domain S-box-containing protein